MSTSNPNRFNIDLIIRSGLSARDFFQDMHKNQIGDKGPSKDLTLPVKQDTLRVSYPIGEWISAYWN